MLQQPSASDARGDDEREEQEHHVVQVQDVLRHVLAQHVGQVGRDHQQQPARRQQRQRAERSDDARDHEDRAGTEQGLEDGERRHMNVGVEADQPAVVDDVGVAVVAEVLLDQAGADQEPGPAEVEDEPPVLADLGGSVRPHQQREHADRVDLVLLAAEREDAQRPHRHAPAAEAGPAREERERERHVLGVKEVTPSLLDRRPERDGRRERDRQPGRGGAVGGQQRAEEEIGGGTGRREAG